jgi:Domain of unknown function (DUF4932)/Bacterial Ig-like domain
MNVANSTPEKHEGTCSMANTRVLFALLITVPFCTAGAQTPTVRVDPRVELTTIVFRLSGAFEYNQCQLPRYAADIDRYFAPFRENAAFKLMAQLREAHDIGFDAVPKLAIALTDPPELSERLDVGADGAGIEAGFDDTRWAGPHARQFIAALRQFAADTKFGDFFAAHRTVYDSAEARLRTFLASEVRLPWFAAFFGEPPTARFFAVPGMCNGGANYGPHVQPRSGAEERYAILGMSRSDSAGLPVMSISGLPPVIHEFSHSFVNPAFARHSAEFSSSGERLLADSVLRRMLAGQAYSEWKTVVDESLVRAVVVRYLRATHGDSAGEAELSAQYARGFLWIRSLDSSLALFERSRDRYPRFEDYLPRLADVLSHAADVLPSAVSAFNAARPRIVSTMPEDGATEVASTDTTITVRFDRPMGPGTSIVRVASAQAAYPEVLRVLWDSSHRMLIMRVVLAPATHYELRFTGTGFQSLDGLPLVSRTVRFSTR